MEIIVNLCWQAKDNMNANCENMLFNEILFKEFFEYRSK